MMSNLLIIGGIAGGYILFAILFYSFVTNMENEAGRQRAQNIFIAINILALCGAMTFAYIRFIEL